jgi:hypothetical protein
MRAKENALFAAQANETALPQTGNQMEGHTAETHGALTKAHLPSAGSLERVDFANGYSTPLRNEG